MTARTFCTNCATPNPPDAPRCEACGEALTGATNVLPASSTPGGSSPARVGSSRVSFRLRLLHGVPIVALLLIGSGLSWTTWHERAAQAEHYRAAEAALIAGDIDAAIEGFRAASGYRDADERLAETLAFREPFYLSYLTGVTAFESGRYADAIAALDPVARALPRFLDTTVLLAEARAHYDVERFRAMDAAEAAHDWLAVEQELGALVADYPSDAALMERFRQFMRLHAPIAFVGPSGLSMIGPDSEDERILTHAIPASHPVWSPDRTLIAFLSQSPAHDSTLADLYVINPETIELTQLASGLTPDQPPVWSPDGTRLAYTKLTARPADDAGSPLISTPMTDVFVVDVATMTERDLSQGRIGPATSPTWSPDSERLALIGERLVIDMTAGTAHVEHTIYIGSVSGGPLTPIAEGQVPDAEGLAWSPTAERLLIRTNTPGDWYGPPTQRILDLDLTTGELRPVTHASADVTAPVWAPDGQRFAFIEGSDIVRVIGAERGEAWISIATPLNGHLVWSPDSRAILVTDADPTRPARLIGLDGGVGTSPVPIMDVHIPYRLSNDTIGLPSWAGSAAPDATFSRGGGTARDPLLTP